MELPVQEESGIGEITIKEAGSEITLRKPEVAAAALVIVGTLMVSVLREIDFSDFSVALPVVLTVAVMPLSYSIANGIGVGFISWSLIHAMSRRGRDVHWLLWVVSAGFIRLKPAWMASR